MVYINEWFPNPAGNEAKGEFIELFNSGATSVNLSGWTLKATGKKVFSLDGYSIAAGGYLVLPRSKTKISLKNSGETVSLYGPGGQLVDQSSYLGAAPSGQSFSRVYYPTSGSSSSGMVGSIKSGDALAEPQSFTWAAPTPAAPNKAKLYDNISVINYPFDKPLNQSSASVPEIFEIVFAVGVILASLVIYCLKHEENFADIVFPRNNRARQ